MRLKRQQTDAIMAAVMGQRLSNRAHFTAQQKAEAITMAVRGCEIAYIAQKTGIKIANLRDLLRRHNEIIEGLRDDLPVLAAPTIKLRCCMMCKRDFQSRHIGERICLSCKSTDAWKEGDRALDFWDHGGGVELAIKFERDHFHTKGH